MTMLCSHCGKEFELYMDFFKPFCSVECEMKSKYGYIYIKKNEIAKVIECDKDIEMSQYIKDNHLISDKSGYLEDYEFITGYDFGMGIKMDRYYDDEVVPKNDLNLCACLGLGLVYVGNVVIYNCNYDKPMPLHLANMIADKINNAYLSKKDKELPDWLKVYK